jgi:hypothetical protein
MLQHNSLDRKTPSAKGRKNSSPRSFGLSATSQQYFSLRTNHQQTTSSTFLSEQISTRHQPNERVAYHRINVS